MTPTQEIIDTNYGGWKGVLIDWLVRQGVSTVLLFAILAALVKGMPLMLQEQRDARERFASILEAQRLEFRDDVKSLSSESIATQKELVRTLGELNSVVLRLEKKVENSK